MSIAIPNRSSLRGVLPWVVLGAGVLLSVLNLAFGSRFFSGRGASSGDLAIAASDGDTPAPAKSGALPTTVVMPENKLKIIGVQCAPATLASLPAELGAPGRIEANQERQVLIRPRAQGVVRSVAVALGAKVKKGQLLAVLDSPEVGKERLNLRAKQRELATIRFEADWKKRIGENVAALVPLLKQRVEAPVIQKQFANRPLGSFRSSMLDAYAKFDIASHEEEKTIDLRKEGLVGEHPLFLAVHNREGAQGVFDGIVEQATFDANQQFKVAQRDVRTAEETVIEAAQRLRILGVLENVQDLLDHAGESTLNALADEDVTAYEITAPFDGTILTRAAVPSQKVEVSDVLFSLADVSTVWVMVNIPESDFALLPALKKGKIRVSSTAYPGPPFEARLLSVGATVDATTRTVPMIAEAQNPDDLLKLGMFVRISLDTAVRTEALTIPAAAVVEIEGKTGVFQPDAKDPHTFHFKPVTVRREAGDRLVLSSGLSDGAQVVCKGAFELKSELILQNEDDEE